MTSVKNGNKEKDSIVFSITKAPEFLTLGHDGVITWMPNGKEKIIIGDKKMLCVALMDVICKLSPELSIEKVDKNLYEEYLKIINQKEDDKSKI